MLIDPIGNKPYSQQNYVATYIKQYYISTQYFLPDNRQCLQTCQKDSTMQKHRLNRSFYWLEINIIL